MFGSVTDSYNKVTGYFYQAPNLTQDVLKVLSWQVNNWEEDNWYQELPDTVDLTFSAKADNKESILYQAQKQAKKALTTQALTDIINVKDKIPSAYTKELRLEFSFSFGDSETSTIKKVTFFVSCIGKAFTNAKCNVEYGKMFKVIKFSTLAPEGYVDQEDMHYLHPVIIP